jgi:hypothetical protein
MKMLLRSILATTRQISDAALVNDIFKTFMEMLKAAYENLDVTEQSNATQLYSIGITTGAQSREQLLSANPDFVISDLMELLPIIECCCCRMKLSKQSLSISCYLFPTCVSTDAKS